MRHLQFAPRPVALAPVVAAAAIGAVAPFNTGVPTGIGSAAVNA
jgi:hypothetical protein